jgi:hypothetical protein
LDRPGRRASLLLSTAVSAICNQCQDDA